MNILEVAKLKAGKAQCTKCSLLHCCTSEVSKICFDNYVKGFIAGYKYKRKNRTNE